MKFTKQLSEIEILRSSNVFQIQTPIIEMKRRLDSRRFI